MSHLSKKVSVCMAALASVALLTAPGKASALDLKGKTVTWIVPFKEGGGSDTLARLLQPHLQEALPGNPTVLVLNQPGGGSTTAANKFHQNGKTDGTELFIASSSTLVPATLGAKKVKYDPTEWRGIVGLPRGTLFYVNAEKTGVSADADIKTNIKALRSADLLHGIKAPTGARLLDLSALEMLDVNVRPIFGLSTSKARKAFMRGETVTNSDGTGPFLKRMDQLKKEANAVPLFSYGAVAADGSVQRDPDLPDVPTFEEAYEAVHGKAPSGPGYQALRNLMNNKVTLSKSVMLPKGTPDAIVQAYVDVFKNILQKPEVQKGLKKNIGSMTPTFGADTDAALAAGLKMQDDSREWLQTLLSTKYNASL